MQGHRQTVGKAGRAGCPGRPTLPWAVQSGNSGSPPPRAERGQAGAIGTDDVEAGSEDQVGAVRRPIGELRESVRDPMLIGTIRVHHVDVVSRGRFQKLQAPET